MKSARRYLETVLKPWLPALTWVLTARNGACVQRISATSGVTMPWP